MFKEYFILLLLAHVIGDFYVQTSAMAKKKEESIKFALIHCFCYWTTIMVISLSCISWKVIVFGSIAALTHMIIDLSKYLYVIKLKKKNKMTMFKERNIFFLDQLLHFIC